VWAATVAFGALAAVWSVMAPLGEAPDETAHLALVWHLADGGSYPDYDNFQSQAASFRLCGTFASATRACPRRGEPVTATSTRRHPVDDAPDKANRPAWDDGDGARSIGPLNQMSQHPPAYYVAMAAVVRVERALNGGPLSADRELALLRLVNVLVVMPLPLLAWWAARRFGYDDVVGLGAALAMLAVPMLTHLGSTLNNDNLFTLCGAVAVALLAGVLRGDRTTRTAVALGLVTALALLTKGFGVVLPPLIVASYLIGLTDLAPEGWWARLRRLVVPLAWVGGSTVVLGAWWYVRVHARTGQFAPSLEAQRLTSALRPAGFSPDVVAFAREFGRLLDTRFWGSYGWYSVRTPTWWALLATAVVLAAVIAAFVERRDDSDASRVQRTGLLGPFVALGAFVVARSWNLYVLTGGYRFIQGRYLFAGLGGVAVLAAAGGRRAVGRRLPVVVLGVAALAQFEALRETLPGWWGDVGLGPRGQLRALVAWSGWPGEMVVMLFVVAVFAGGWLVWEVVRAARASVPEPVESVAP